MKSIYATVFRPETDCTNHGVSEKRNHFILYSADTTIEQIKAEIEKLNGRMKIEDCLLVKGKSDYIYCTPVFEVNGKVSTGFMAGGNFIYSSDSRFEEISGCSHPIPIHDRTESWELYNALST